MPVPNLSRSPLRVGRRRSRAFLLLVAGVGGSLFVSIASAQTKAEDNTLRKLNESVDALIRKVSPSVVQVLGTGYGKMEETERGNTGVVIGRQKAIGSGFM